MPVKLTRESCGEQYETPPSKAKRTDSNYCSQSCYSDSIGGGKVEVSCEWCGEQFERYASNVADSTFCDKECHDKHQRENPSTDKDAPGWKGGKKVATCDWCGCEYSDYPSRIERTDGNYCSRDCTWKSRREESDIDHRRVMQSGEWRVVRERVLERDRKRCQECGHGENLHVHHITPLSEGGEKYDMDNLVTLCQTCHLRAYHN